MIEFLNFFVKPGDVERYMYTISAYFKHRPDIGLERIPHSHTVRSYIQIRAEVIVFLHSLVCNYADVLEHICKP